MPSPSRLVHLAGLEDCTDIETLPTPSFAFVERSFTAVEAAAEAAATAAAAATDAPADDAPDTPAAATATPPPPPMVTGPGTAVFAMDKDEFFYRTAELDLPITTTDEHVVLLEVYCGSPTDIAVVREDIDVRRDKSGVFAAVHPSHHLRRVDSGVMVLLALCPFSQRVFLTNPIAVGWLSSTPYEKPIPKPPPAPTRPQTDGHSSATSEDELHSRGSESPSPAGHSAAPSRHASRYEPLHFPLAPRAVSALPPPDTDAASALPFRLVFTSYVQPAWCGSSSGQGPFIRIMSTRRLPAGTMINPEPFLVS